MKKRDIEAGIRAHTGQHAVIAGVRVAMTAGQKAAMMPQAGSRESSIVS